MKRMLALLLTLTLALGLLAGCGTTVVVAVPAPTPAVNVTVLQMFFSKNVYFTGGISFAMEKSAIFPCGFW